MFLAATLPAVAGPQFAYTDTYRVLTLEFKGENLAILNVLNLSDSLMVLQASDLLILRSDGSAVPGQVFAGKGRGGELTFTATQLVQAHSTLGTDIQGAFHADHDILKVYISQGGRYFELAALSPAQFESLFSRLSQLDMESANVEKMFETESIPDLGVYMTFEESDSVRSIHEKLFTDEGVNPPRILTHPRPILTPAARKAGFKSKITLTIKLTDSGYVAGIRMDPTPGFGMAERIGETIRNAWQFLPATLNGETVPTEMTYILDYGVPDGSGKTETPR